MSKGTPNTVRGAAWLLLVGACAGPVAPEKPTWEADVYPILQGQCLHCHGATAVEHGNGRRLDFFDDLKDLKERCGNIEYDAQSDSVSFNITGLIGVVEPEGSFPAFMPPPPASPLEEWQIETIRRWQKIIKEPAARGTQKTTQDPVIRITSKLPETVGSSFKFKYVVEDGNLDSVIGILKLGGEKVADIHSAGAGEVEIKNISGDSGRELEISAELCDGWNKVDRGNLGRVKKE